MRSGRGVAAKVSFAAVDGEQRHEYPIKDDAWQIVPSHSASR